MKADGGVGKRGKSGERRSETLSGLEFVTIGIEFTTILLVLGLGGAWLDRRLGTSPLLLIVGMMAGAGGGIYSMYRRLTRRSARGHGPEERGRG